MNFCEFESEVIRLNESGQYDAADGLMDQYIDVIENLDSNSPEFLEFVKFYAESAGDAESLFRFDRLMDKVGSRLDSSTIQKLTATLPANRYF